MKIGIHALPEAVYRAADPVCQSDLKLLVNQCPAKAREAKLHPKEQTKAQFLGVGGHHAVLQPEIFEQEYVARPASIDRRTKVGKKAYEDFQRENKGKVVMDADDFDLCLEIRDAVWKNPVAADMLSGPKKTEVSACWDDPETGIRCKGRIDCIGSWGIVDLKTAKDASDRAFARDAANFGYHFQAAFYLDGLNALAPRERQFFMIVVEKTPPYCVALYEFDWESIEAGRREYRSALLTWKECTESGVWPGYPADVQTLELPRWALSRADEEIL